MGNNANGSIMSVELAIERELEYRQKVKMFGLEPFGDSGWKEFLPMQVPDQPTVVPTRTTNTKPRKPYPTSILAKRKAETSNVESHLDRYFCSLCQVTSSGPIAYKMHLRGKQHGAKLGNRRVYNYRQSAVISHRCKTCRILCSDEKALKMHLEGQKHLTRVQKLEHIEECGVEDASVRKWCELYKIWCMNKSSFGQHLEGKKHVKNLHMKKNGDKEDDSILKFGLACDDIVS